MKNISSPFSLLNNIYGKFNHKKESQDFDYFSSQVSNSKEMSQENFDFFSSQIKKDESESLKNSQNSEFNQDIFSQNNNESQNNDELSQSQSENPSQSQEDEINIFLNCSKVIGKNPKINIYCVPPKNKENKKLVLNKNDIQIGYNPFNFEKGKKNVNFNFNEEFKVVSEKFENFDITSAKKFNNRPKL